MADPLLYQYDSPLKNYQTAPPLTDDLNEDGKSFKNPSSATRSAAYTSFVDPITNGSRGGFDAHIYFNQANDWELRFARELWERIRREFPELRIYKVFDRPLGPHPIGMFEVNMHTPEQFGAFVPWLVINRGPLSALVHPNTNDEYRDHTQRATWLGQQIPLNLRPLKEYLDKEKLEQEG